MFFFCSLKGVWHEISNLSFFQCPPGHWVIHKDHFDFFWKVAEIGNREWMLISGVNDTGNKLLGGVNDTGDIFFGGVNDTGDLDSPAYTWKWKISKNSISRCNVHSTKLSTKIKKNIPQNFFHLSLVSLTPLINIHLRLSPRIFEKIRNDPNGILRALIYEKNLKSKILCQTPFKCKGNKLEANYFFRSIHINVASVCWQSLCILKQLYVDFVHFLKWNTVDSFYVKKVGQGSGKIIPDPTRAPSASASPQLKSCTGAALFFMR